MNDEKRAQFLPFHALNEFMTDEFRSSVVRSTLNTMPDIPERYRVPVDRLINKLVRIHGFKNSARAPIIIKVKPVADAIKNSPDLTAALIAAWAEAHAVLRQLVYDFLLMNNWELLPIEADRRRLPGFIPRWPQGVDFESLYLNFSENYPDSGASMDEVSLMAVWLTTRLPFEKGGDDESGHL